MKEILNKVTAKFLIKAQVSDDDMKLFIDVFPPAAPPGEPSPEASPGEEAGVAAAPDPAPAPAPVSEASGPVCRQDLIDVLGEVVPTENLHLGVLDDVVEFLRRGEATERRRVLKGIEPLPGMDGRLVYLVKRMGGRAHVKIDEHGMANYADLHLFDNVVKGQIVARIYPPRAGTDGRDIFGKVVPFRPGRTVEPVLAESVARRKSGEPGDDFDVLVSGVDGYVSEDAGAVCVKERLEIKGNLGFNFGNIDFIGSVAVHGDVLNGFQVKARRAIEVDGEVCGARLICSDGPVIVKGMVFGAEESQCEIVCRGDFSALGVHDARVETCGDIVLRNEGHQAQLRAQGALILAAGSLVAGEAFTARGVEAKYLGNEIGTVTRIHLCSDIQTTSEYSTLAVNIDNVEKAVALLKSHLGPFVEHPDEIQTLRPGHREKMLTLHAKFGKLKDALIILKNRRDEMLKSAKVQDQIPVCYSGRMFSGVELLAGEQRLDIQETLEGPGALVFMSAQGEFKPGEFRSFLAQEASNQGGKEGVSSKR